MGTSTRRYRRIIPVALLAVGVIALVLALSSGGAKAKHHGRTPHRTARTVAARVTRIRPIATVDDVTSTGDNQDPANLTLNIYDLRRQGPFVVLDFGVLCPTPQAGCNTAFVFPYSTSQGYNTDASDEEVWQDSLGTFGGISVLDPVGDVEYLSVKNAGDGHPDSSSAAELNDSDIHLGWVKFPAPPAGVQALDVLLPEGGPVVTHVPITDGPAPTPAQIAPTAQAAVPNTDVPAVSSESTAGLVLSTDKLVETVGNPAGSDTESPQRSTLSLSSDVLFRFAKSNLTPAAHAVSQNVAARISAGATGTVTVTGYTDSIGTDGVNIPLSQARARSVVNALKQLTAGASVSYAASGMGSADPVAPNTLPDGRDNPAGRRLNRRVTISYAVKSSTQPAPPPSAAAIKLPPAAPAGSTLQYTASQLGGGTDVYHVSVDRVTRDANTTLLELSVACVAASKNQSCNEDDLMGSDTAPPLPFADYAPSTGFSPGAELQLIFTSTDSVSDFYLQDPTTGEILSPLHEVEYDHPISVTTPNVWPIGPTYRVWVYFPGTPATATQMVVWLPSGANGVEVPISGAGA
jgi:OmpA-OmpF porin, OOP family